MLKRISVEHLRTGMFIQELCGSWMEHPFWRTAFVLKDPGDITRIRESGIKEVWIDTHKGLDVPVGQAKEESDTVVEQQLEAVASSAPPIHERASLAQEMDRARKVCNKSKEAVATMFQEARMGKALDADEALPLVEEISSSIMRNPGALLSLARLKNKDEYTYMHSVAVCALMVALARQLGLDDVQTKQAGLAGMLHDVGKMMIPSEILDKPGKLTDEEFALMKQHTAYGLAVIRHSSENIEGDNFLSIAGEIAIAHHENWDGTGYPNSLAGTAIPL